MEGITLPQIATYISYIFVVLAYTIKVRKYFMMPKNLRWDLYPISHEKGYKHGGSYFEEFEFWKKERHTSLFRDIIEIAKKYIAMGGYYRRVKSYWFVLYPWHISFYLIVLFHGLALIGAVVIQTTGIAVTSSSANIGGQILFYLTLVVAVSSFILGTIGSIGLLIKRLADEDLREYASKQNYFNYIFFLSVFVSGLVSWIVTGNNFEGYREFWVGLISLKGVEVHPAEYVHIMLFSMFLIYLPFTRSTHYITKILAFFKVRWDDAPNLGDGATDERLLEYLNYRVSWSAPHIQTGKTWGEVVTLGLPEEEGKS